MSHMYLVKNTNILYITCFQGNTFTRPTAKHIFINNESIVYKTFVYKTSENSKNVDYELA